MEKIERVILLIQLIFLDRSHCLPNFLDQLHDWIFQRSGEELFVYQLVGGLELTYYLFT
jgi:hypothetical protein